MATVLSFIGSNTQITRNSVASCPGTKRAIGGGAAIVGSINEALNPIGAFITSSFPTGTGQDQWFASAVDNPDNGADWRLKVWVICANVEP